VPVKKICHYLNEAAPPGQWVDHFPLTPCPYLILTNMHLLNTQQPTQTLSEIVSPRDFINQENAMGKIIERRQYFRLAYGDRKKPMLMIGADEFQILDISQNGLKFLNTTPIELPKSIKGTIFFINGNHLEIDGFVKRKKNNSFGLFIEKLIPAHFLEEEMLAITNFAEAPGENNC